MIYWEKKEKLFKYTEGIRRFFPLAEEQMDLISRLLRKYRPGIETFLDLGCGDGFLGFFIGRLYPGARGVFVDISGEMIGKALKRSPDPDFEFIVQDLGEKDWFISIKSVERFDLVISGYAIHHIGYGDKYRLYRDVCLSQTDRGRKN